MGDCASEHLLVLSNVFRLLVVDNVRDVSDQQECGRFLIEFYLWFPYLGVDSVLIFDCHAGKEL